LRIHAGAASRAAHGRQSTVCAPRECVLGRDSSSSGASPSYLDAPMPRGAPLTSACSACPRRDGAARRPVRLSCSGQSIIRQARAVRRQWRRLGADPCHAADSGGALLRLLATFHWRQQGGMRFRRSQLYSRPATLDAVRPAPSVCLSVQHGMLPDLTGSGWRAVQRRQGLLGAH
jgi:hypothetical protein